MPSSGTYWKAFDDTLFLTEQEAIDYETQALENLKREALRQWITGLGADLTISKLELLVEGIIKRTLATASTELTDIDNLTL